MRTLFVLGFLGLASFACDNGCDLAPSGGGDPDGPVASDRELCEGTRGAWTGSRCECAQDGATRFNEFVPAEGCRFPDDSDLREDLATLPLYETIAETFAVGQPVYLIDRPGVFDVVHTFATIASLRAHIEPMGWLEISADVGRCDAALVSAAIPSVDCESDVGMSQGGCILSTVNDEFHRVSDQMQAAVDYGFGSYSAATIAAARAQEGDILKVFVNSEHGVTLAFRRHAGAWILVVVDLSRYSCSA